jgi:hypothetical protein
MFQVTRSIVVCLDRWGVRVLRSPGMAILRDATGFNFLSAECDDFFAEHGALLFVFLSCAPLLGKVGQSVSYQSSLIAV